MHFALCRMMHRDTPKNISAACIILSVAVVVLHEYMCLFSVSCFIGFLQCQAQIVKAKMLYLRFLWPRLVFCFHINCYRLRSSFLSQFSLLAREKLSHVIFYTRKESFAHWMVATKKKYNEWLQLLCTFDTVVWMFFSDVSPQLNRSYT